MRIFMLCLLFFHNYIAYSENIPTKNEIKRGPILNKVTCNSLHQNGGTWKSYCARFGRICDDSGDRAKCCQEGDENCIEECDLESNKAEIKKWISICNKQNMKCIMEGNNATCKCHDTKLRFDEHLEMCIDQCYQYMSKEDFNAITWNDFCFNVGAVCVSSNKGIKCECRNGKVFSEFLEKCIDPCEEYAMKDEYTTWRDFCSIVGAQCIKIGEEITCECKKGLEYSRKVDICFEQCDKHAMKNESIKWKDFCSIIGADCTSSQEGTTCLCETGKLYDDNLEKCVDQYKTCDSIIDGTRTWEEFCKEKGFGSCRLNENILECECFDGEEFDHDRMDCIEKPDITCNSKIEDKTKTWDAYCNDADIGPCKEVPGRLPECTCPYGKKFDHGERNCITDQCYLIKDDRELTWNDFCLDSGAVCVSSNEGTKCECEDGKVFSEVLEKCIEPCDEDAMKDEYITWKDFCSIVGAQCVKMGEETTCECGKGLEYSRKVDICFEQCDKHAMKNETIKWKDFCSTIGADCVSSQERTTCLCETDKVYDDNLEKCVDKYATCDTVIDGTRTWNEFCKEKGFGPCRISENLPECKCSSEEKFDHDKMDCIERQLTCDSIIPGGTKTWNQFCIEKELLCEDEDVQAECLCPYGEKFDRNLMNCVRDIPRLRNCKKLCLNGGYCSLNNGSEVCICSSTFTGENCERPNFCKIHHQDGLSGEEYCERGDAECISEENLVCHCYNPHRYFDYETGMCINPCTTRPCRNKGRCIFKGTPNPACECNPYFIGNRCEEVNWCRIKRISGRTIERYCASNGAFCGIIGTGKVDCICKDHDYEFNHSLQKCIEIDVCAVNRRGFQDCSLKNAICKKDILTKSGDKYVCECPSGRKMLENGTCAENTICEKGEKGYEICNRRRANCVINDFQTEGFECECEEGYAPNDYERCIDINVCTEGHEGYKECESRDAICLHNFDNDLGYECGCKPGYKMTEIGICVEITECDNGQIGYRECRAKNANCIQDLRNYKRYKCVCPERYALDINGRCRKKNFGISYLLQAHNSVIPYTDPCDEGNPGYIECMKINAICISNNYSYSCQCRPNQKLDSNGICTDLEPCDKGEIGFKECEILSSVCIQSKATLKGYKCECSELHVVDQFGRCVNNFYSK